MWEVFYNFSPVLSDEYFILLALTLCIIPSVIYVASTDEPPALINGNVIPTIGSMQRHIPIFSMV